MSTSLGRRGLFPFFLVMPLVIPLVAHVQQQRQQQQEREAFVNVEAGGFWDEARAQRAAIRVLSQNLEHKVGRIKSGYNVRIRSRSGALGFRLAAVQYFPYTKTLVHLVLNPSFKRGVPGQVTEVKYSPVDAQDIRSLAQAHGVVAEIVTLNPSIHKKSATFTEH